MSLFNSELSPLRGAMQASCADRETVLRSVKQCGYALQYASAELRADREIVFG